MQLLREAHQRRADENQRAAACVRAALRGALTELLPSGSQVWLYGSLTKAARFAEWSDVDLALEREPDGMSIYLLMSLLAERTGRVVDVTLLRETRLRESIVNEGELWTM